MRYILTVFILASFFISGCSSSQNKPSPLDKYWGNQEKSFAYKKFTAPKKWAAGQYTVIGVLDKGKKDSVMRTTIVRKEETGWVYEIITINKKGKTSGMQMLIEGFGEAAANKSKYEITLKWIKILGEDGSVQLVEGDMLGFFNSFYRSQFYKSQVDQYAASEQAYEQTGPVTVPAGTFKGTTAIKTQKMSIFMHPEVPVNGMVKATDEKGKTVFELLDFGSNGKATIQ